MTGVGVVEAPGSIAVVADAWHRSGIDDITHQDCAFIRVPRELHHTVVPEELHRCRNDREPVSVLPMLAEVTDAQLGELCHADLPAGFGRDFLQDGRVGDRGKRLCPDDSAS
jgi:hypothetical protein